MLRMRVVKVTRMQGVGRKSGAAYNFQTVGGLVEFADGADYVEVMIDGEAPTPKPGEFVDLVLSWHPDREKRLAFRVEELRHVSGSSSDRKAA